MNRRIFFFLALLSIAGHCVFGQASALRDYVGMISQSFHPESIAFLEKLKTDMEKRNRHAAARILDSYIKGDSGTGFVYVAPNGTNYMLTNYHVISHAETLSVTFEKQDGEKTKFTGLTIIAADEDMDIALLAFAGGQNPFKEGLRLQTRPMEEGNDVYSAGFPGLGTAMIWQLGRGMVSNASVRLPDNDNPDKMIGPFIQHTAEVDGGNSGGPLLVQTQGVPTGFAVVGINTLKARDRQAANYAIPVARIQRFLDASLKKEPVDERALLDARLESFIEGMRANKAVYPHIAAYLSNACVGENAEFALSQLFSKGNRTAQEDILNSFGRPVEGMRQAVAWYIENQTRSKSGSLNVATESVTANDTGYTVTFNVNDKMINSEWVNEYGIWRIHKFGDFASGDKELREKNAKAAAKAKAAEKALRTDSSIQISADFMYLLERESPALGLDFVVRSKYMGFGVRGCFGEEFAQGVMFVGPYIPIKLGASAALTPFGNVGVGMQFKGTGTVDAWGDDKGVFIGISAQAGLQFITAAVPGLYLQVGYQFNYFELFDVTVDKKPSVSDQHAIFVGIGYAF